MLFLIFLVLIQGLAGWLFSKFPKFWVLLFCKRFWFFAHRWKRDPIFVLLVWHFRIILSVRFYPGLELTANLCYYLFGQSSDKFIIPDLVASWSSSSALPWRIQQVIFTVFLLDGIRHFSVSSLAPQVISENCFSAPWEETRDESVVLIGAWLTSEHLFHPPKISDSYFSAPWRETGVEAVVMIGDWATPEDLARLRRYPSFPWLYCWNDGWSRGERRLIPKFYFVLVVYRHPAFLGLHVLAIFSCPSSSDR